MADPPPDAGDDTSTPRWVKVFGIVAIVLVLLFVILHLTGGGVRRHTLSSSIPAQSEQRS